MTFDYIFDDVYYVLIWIKMLCYLACLANL